MDINAVDSFCHCISGDDQADPAAQAFCTRASKDPMVTGEDLAELKMALMDMEDDACCEC
jgi:hypothetical protein